MRIAAYVVSDPLSQEEILHELLDAIASARMARLKLTSVDIFPEEERVVEFGVRQVDVDDFGQRHFIGTFFEGTGKMVINVSIPTWDEETTAKIGQFPSSNPA